MKPFLKTGNKWFFGKNRNRTAKSMFVIGSTAAALIISALPSSASTLVSQDGDLRLQLRQCSPNQVAGTYSLSNGISGVLSTSNCDQPGDSYRLRFVDNAGRERCYGQVTVSWSRWVSTTWNVEGAVSGYRCSEAGKRIEVRMQEIR